MDVGLRLRGSQRGSVPGGLMASPVQLTPPAIEPVSVDELKAHLRVTDASEDDLIAAYGKAARAFVETRCQRSLITQEWRYKLDEWPYWGPVYLPMGPVQEVLAIDYIDTNGDITAWDTDLFYLDEASSRARLFPVYGESWPSIRYDANAITIEYRAGYGDLATDVPEELRHAIKLLVGHWYQSREAVVIGQVPNAVPFAVDALLSPYLVYA